MNPRGSLLNKFTPNLVGHGVQAFGWAVFLHLMFLTTDDLSAVDLYRLVIRPFPVASLLFSVVIREGSPDFPIFSLIPVANVVFIVYLILLFLWYSKGNVSSLDVSITV